MKIGKAKDGDIVAIGSRIYRIMIHSNKSAIGCREVIAGTTPDRPGFELSELHSFIGRDVEVEMRWRNEEWKR